MRHFVVHPDSAGGRRTPATLPAAAVLG